MGQALYRKYRSKSLSEILGQDHIITTLRNALKQGTISHAYLFTGPRGVGKTSIARILAHEIIEQPYNEETTHIDIIEIDAASNRRIDEIRDLRDKVHIAPSSAKYKIYIIDEVHMLTKEAFNALLKTLEEPPEHAIFILATTEVHKLPETIVSRTQHFTFKSIEAPKAIEHLRNIAKDENINISDDALALIAEHGDGSFRDSISMLDQISSSSDKSIEADDIRRMLGIAPVTAIKELLKLTLSGTPATILDHLLSLQEQGYEPSQTAKQLSGLVRSQLLESDPSDALVLARLLRQLIDVPASNDPATRLEVVLLEVNLRHAQPTVADIAPKPVPTSEPVISAPEPPSQPPKESKPKAAPVAAAPKVDQPVVAITDFDTAWQSVLGAIKQQYNTLYGVLRMADASQQDDEIVLAFKFAFHQKRVDEAKNRKIISDILQEKTGSTATIKCIVSDSATPAPTPKTKAAPNLDNISNIFGATEVLES